MREATGCALGIASDRHLDSAADGPGDVPLRLRPRGRLRRRLPRGDRADRARGARSSTSPTGSPATTSAPARWSCAARCRSRRPGVHLAVVDPGVGAERRAVALRATEEDRILVGPDNGLLSLAAQRFGGVAEAVDIGASPHRLEPVARRSTAATSSRRSPRTSPRARRWPTRATRSTPTRSSRSTCRSPFLDGGELVAHAVGFDRFGNVMLDVEHARADRRRASSSATASTSTARAAVYATTFADVAPGELLLYEDAYRTLALAVNRGSARELLGARARRRAADPPRA